MQDTSPQQPESRSFARYRLPVTADLMSGIGNSAYGYVAAAAGLGLMLGVAVAVTAGHGKVVSAPHASATLTAHTSGLSMLPAVYTGPALSLLHQVDDQRKANAVSPSLLSVSEKSARRPVSTHKRHGLHRLLNWKKGTRSRKAVKRAPYVSPNQPVADEPTALQLATAAAAAGPFFLGVQGDVTVANYDAATGTVQTYEGETYLLAKASIDNSAIPWRDYPFNVHYSCDGIGNCTLSHAGGSAIAKLTR